MAVIELDGLERRYGERVALAGVSVRVDEGQTLAVLGGNGAGKTTLLRVLAGLLRPHAGRAVVLGAELPRERWRLPGRVGYLGHEPLLYRELSGRENLTYHARLHGTDPQRVDEVLAAVGMEGRADEPLRELSRGMVQRLAVARAVLHDPQLLLLDEPRAGLDPAGAELRRAADRACLGPHARAREPRRGGRAGRVRRGPAPEAWPPRRRGRGAVPVIHAARAILRKDLLIELRTKESVPAMTLFTVTVYVLFHFGLDRDTLEGSWRRASCGSRCCWRRSSA